MPTGTNPKRVPWFVIVGVLPVSLRGSRVDSQMAPLRQGAISCDRSRSLYGGPLIREDVRRYVLKHHTRHASVARLVTAPYRLKVFLLALLTASQVFPIWGGWLGGSLPAAQARTRAVPIDGWLRTRGTRILEEDGGQRVRLLSISIPHLGPGDGKKGTSERGCPSWRPVPDFTAVDVKEWGFNSVRLNISWANLEPVPPNLDGTHNWNLPYLEELTTAVESFAAQGIAVILQMHQVRWSPAFNDLSLQGGRTLCEGIGMPAWLYPDGGGEGRMVRAEKRFFRYGEHQSEFITAWKHVVDLYKDDPAVVAVDLLNEPYDLLFNGYPRTRSLRPRDLKLVRFYERVARAVHGVNPKLLIMVEDRRSDRTGRWSVTREPDVPRSVFTHHFYARKWTREGRRRMDEAYRRSLSWRRPTWVGEVTCFNRCVNGEPYPRWPRKTRQMLRYSRERGIGWAVWLYGPGQFQRASNIHLPKPKLLDVIRSGF
jgi:hypothetical protein